MSLMDALRSRAVGDEADEVGVRASCGAAGDAGGSASPIVASGSGPGVEGVWLVV